MGASLFTEKIAAVAAKEKNLQQAIELHEVKLEWLTGQRRQQEVNKATGVINIMGKSKGFGAMLNNIRMRKKEQSLIRCVCERLRSYRS